MQNTSHPLIEHLESTQSDVKKSIACLSTIHELEALRITILGRNGVLAGYTQEFKALSSEHKRLIGPLLQELKASLHQAIEEKKKQLESQSLQILLPAYDVTTPKPGLKQGSLHPLSHITASIQDIFSSMGYCLVEGPELETEYYNFTALNIDADHPARQLADTLWVDNTDLLLRTHTSSVQIRTLQHQKPPLAIAAIGRVYRHEATDATHDYMFHQVEGLLVDRDISMKHLLGTLTYFFRALFENDRLTIRIRPSYFPFVKPGIEVDVSCPFCKQGCSICKKTQWIEMGGAGLVHNNVLQSCAIDTSYYSGFAFGFGVSRIAMLKYAINDVRYLTSNRLDFLMQF